MKHWRFEKCHLPRAHIVDLHHRGMKYQDGTSNAYVERVGRRAEIHAKIRRGNEPTVTVVDVADGAGTR